MGPRFPHTHLKLLIRSLSGSGITIPGRSRAKSKSGGSRKSSGGGTPVPGLSTAQPNPESVTNRNPDGVGRNDNANVSVESRASDQDTVLRPSIHISSTADSRPTTAHVNANDAPYSRTVDLSSTPATRTNHTSFNAREDTNTNSDILHPSELRNSTSNSNLNPDRNIHQPATTIEQSHTILPHLRPQHLTVSPSSYSTFLLSNDPPVVIMQRKVWVRRPSASATLVTVQDDDLVDSVRDMIMHKYANSLGRTIDSPDITLKITTREQAGKSISQERVLGPEEIIGRTLDVYYPGGQTIDEALIIEVPQRRTPRPSPRPGNHHQSYYVQDPYRPDDAAREYFPPMAVHSPHLPHIPTLPPQHPTNSIAILTSGQLAPLPSPGAHGSRRPARPKYPRQHTSSPTIMHSQQAHSHSNLIGLRNPSPVKVHTDIG
jgi:osomolarity two-component system, response regulator SSK1